MLLKWLLQGPVSNYTPVGFLDEDPYKVGRVILGVPILGSSLNLEEILQRTGAEGILLPPQTSMDANRQENLVKRCQDAGVWCQQTRMAFDYIA
jgi:FlaA1/EpsC-like NDP-sugar epimerase